MKILPVLLSDSYKQFHVFQYPKGLTKLYSNFTPRSFKHSGTDRAVWFGLQYYIKEYLLDQWNELFFDQPLEKIIAEYKRFHKHFSFVEDIDTTHIEQLWHLGYLPLSIKSLPEGAKTKARIPTYTITNTVDGFGWLVNFLETQMSTVIWDLTTIATIGYQFRQVLDEWAIKTTGSKDAVQWQGHDFSMRGRSSVESTYNQAGWLLSFTGTDTIPAVMMLEHYYNANIEKELVGSSVPATEHSVMTSYGKENELDAFIRILDQFPTGIVSVVSDSFDYWSVVTQFTVQLKDRILARDGKLVLRPDSGDPLRIIAGYRIASKDKIVKNPEVYLDEDGRYYLLESVGDDYQLGKEISEAEAHGSIEMLWRVFGGTTTEQGYKVLDSHIGLIYGDSIDLRLADNTCALLAEKGFASTNVVFGVGSYTMNYNTRDTLGIAVKSTYCEVEVGGVIEKREIFKAPKTDDGMKNSAKGLIRIDLVDGDYELVDQVSEEEELKGELKEVFRDGVLLKDYTLTEIRERLNN